MLQSCFCGSANVRKRRKWGRGSQAAPSTPPPTTHIPSPLFLHGLNPCYVPPLPITALLIRKTSATLQIGSSCKHKGCAWGAKQAAHHLHLSHGRKGMDIAVVDHQVLQQACRFL